MDFASLMSSEIAKAKPKADSPTESSSSPSNNQKYIRRSEAEAARQAAYHAEQAALEAKRAAKAAEKRKREEEAAEEARAREDKRRKLEESTRRRREEAAAAEERARRKRLGLPEEPQLPEATPEAEDDEDEDPGHEDLSDEALRDRLRALGEPAALFAETRRARLRRYRRLTTTTTTTTTTTAGPVPTTLRLVDEADMKVADGPVPTDKAGRRWLFRQLGSYFEMVLREWEIALAREQQSRNDSASSSASFASKAAVNAMVSSRQNIAPLFRRFEAGDLPADLLDPIVEIVRAAQERRYVDANDGYLRLSIGKAAWPIGVTMVGIHERSAREKLHDGSERGHVMGDEVTRKYLQSIKRCLTFAQLLNAIKRSYSQPWSSLVVLSSFLNL
ncbi:Prp18 [Xylariomycetidae sp. FL0641]|nr:Prp18 [Xylariomycetidae sp. FL0641]